MSDEYTPTTADVQVNFAVGRYGENRREGQLEFRRWLTAHDRDLIRQTVLNDEGRRRLAGIIDAWTDTEGHFDYHRAAQVQLRRVWPRLARAIEDPLEKTIEGTE